MSIHGRFFPKHPHKYLGNPGNIIFRSTWERTFMEYCDTHENVLQWASEEMSIPYYFTGDRKWHHYYPDFLLTVTTATGTNQTWMVEIKPSKQTRQPVAHSKTPNKKYLREAIEYAKNQAKWNAATAYCHNRGWKFRVVTEKDLYPKTA